MSAMQPAPAALRSPVGGLRFVPESSNGTEDGDVCLRVLTSLHAFGTVRAVKAYRLRVDLTPPVPHLPCLDHEAMLHEGIAPHAAAYVEDRENGELHEIVITPSKRRVELDVASTLHEHTTDGQARLLARLREQFPQFNYRVNGLSWLRGDQRVARACRAQVTLREVLVGREFDAIAVALDRLRTVGSLMEKESRVASWSVRTVTGPLLAMIGFLAYRALAELAPELGEGTVTLLRALLVGAAGVLFLYYGLKAVHLTEMANRVWKRTAEYGLILAERRRLEAAAASRAALAVGQDHDEEPQVDEV